MDDIVNNDAVSWSPYHSSRNRGPNVCVSVISLRPLLQEPSHSVAVSSIGQWTPLEPSQGPYPSFTPLQCVIQSLPL